MIYLANLYVLSLSGRTGLFGVIFADFEPLPEAVGRSIEHIEGSLGMPVLLTNVTCLLHLIIASFKQSLNY